MNGLRFESMADMPPRMREAYARQVFPKAQAQQAAAKYHNAPAERIRAVRYTADFSYKFGGKLVVEDVKSKPTRTKEYLRNRKFMRSKFGIDIQEI